MKTALKLTLIYFLMQILGALTACPFCMLYVYLATGGMDTEAAQRLAIVPALLLGAVYMVLYLWRKGFLANDGQMYSLPAPPCLAWSLLAGVAGLFLTDVMQSQLGFLPDLSKQMFDTLESGWPGILYIALLGPVLEELLYRGAITKVLLRKYAPSKAILISGLLFGIVHINPAQVVGAALIGILLSWLYWRTRSLVACILIHILNNSLAVYFNLSHTEAEGMTELLGTPAVVTATVAALVLLSVSVKRLNTCQPGIRLKKPN